jgi:sarcosine oxidase delta subunit
MVADPVRNEQSCGCVDAIQVCPRCGMRAEFTIEESSQATTDRSVCLLRCMRCDSRHMAETRTVGGGAVSRVLIPAAR